MYGTLGSGGGGGGGEPRRRGTSLAAELDRRLAGDEFLGDVIDWWSNTWRARAELYMKFTHGDEAIRPDVFSDHLANFSNNEFAVYMISVISGCGSDNLDNRIAELYTLAPMLGLDSAKLADDAYVREIARKFIAKLEAARTELRNQCRSETSVRKIRKMSPLASKLDEMLASDMPLLDVIRRYSELLRREDDFYEHTDAEYAVQNLSGEDLNTGADVPESLRECWNTLVEARAALRQSGI
jgi:hypothetical protein